MQVAELYYIPIKLTKEQKRILTSERLAAFEKLAETGLRNLAIVEETTEVSSERPQKS